MTTKFYPPETSLENLQRNNERQRRQSQDKLVKVAGERGYTLLSEYVTRGTKMAFRCNNGHTFISTPMSFMPAKSGCPHCAKNAPPTIEELKVIALSHGVQLLSDTYISRKLPLQFQCLKDPSHVYSRCWSVQSNAGRCQLCFRVDLGTRKRYIEELGYRLTNELPEKAKAKITLICPKGHQWLTAWDKFKSGNRCATCFGTVGYNEADIRLALQNEGYELLSKYVGVRAKVDIKCPKGHTYSPTMERWNKGMRCAICSPSRPKTTDEARAYFARFDYDLIGEYKRNGAKQDLVCPAGHQITMTWNGFYRSHSRCFICQISYEESVLYDWLRQHFSDQEIVRHDRVVLGGKELDLYVPHAKLAIEYCGLHWHTTRHDRPIDRHYNKWLKCQKLGIRLVTIFESTWKTHREELKQYLTALIVGDKENVLSYLYKLGAIKANAFDNCYPTPDGFPVMFTTSPGKTAEHNGYPVYDCGWSVVEPAACSPRQEQP